MATEKVRTERAKPVLRQPVPPTEPYRVRWVGAIRLPIAGPYRPWAHLYAGSDGAHWWTVRLWNTDHAEPHVVSTGQLRTFARESGLPSLLRAIDRMASRARRAEGR